MQHQTQISTADKTQLVMRPETEVLQGSNYSEYQTAHRSTCSLSNHNANRTFTSTSRWHPTTMPIVPSQVHLAGTNETQRASGAPV